MQFQNICMVIVTQYITFLIYIYIYTFVFVCYSTDSKFTDKSVLKWMEGNNITNLDF